MKGDERAATGERVEELLLVEVCVMSFCELLGRGHHLESHQLVAALLKPGDDVAHNTALDAVWLYSDESTLLVGSLPDTRYRSLGP